MSETNKVVVHSMGGKILKGTTQDFFPNRPLFHIQPLDGAATVEITEEAEQGWLHEMRDKARLTERLFHPLRFPNS